MARFVLRSPENKEGAGRRRRGLPGPSLLRRTRLLSTDVAGEFSSRSPRRVNKGEPGPVFAPLSMAFSFFDLSLASGWGHLERAPHTPSPFVPLGGPLRF